LKGARQEGVTKKIGKTEKKAKCFFPLLKRELIFNKETNNDKRKEGIKRGRPVIVSFTIKKPISSGRREGEEKNPRGKMPRGTPNFKQERKGEGLRVWKVRSRDEGKDSGIVSFLRDLHPFDARERTKKVQKRRETLSSRGDKKAEGAHLVALQPEAAPGGEERHGKVGFFQGADERHQHRSYEKKDGEVRGMGRKNHLFKNTPKKI